MRCVIPRVGVVKALLVVDVIAPRTGDPVIHECVTLRTPQEEHDARIAQRLTWPYAGLLIANGACLCSRTQRCAQC